MDGYCRVLGKDGAPDAGMIDNSEEEGAPEWEAEDKVNEQGQSEQLRKPLQRIWLHMLEGSKQHYFGM